MDDDLELPPDLDVPSTPTGGGEGYFVPPTKGTSQSQVCKLSVDKYLTHYCVVSSLRLNLCSRNYVLGMLNL